MSNLQAFMVPNVATTREVIVSERFKDENGNVKPFVIKTLSQEEADQVSKSATLPVKKNGVVVDEMLDKTEFGKALVLACVVEPNLQDAELCKFYKTLDPKDVPNKMLRAGEYTRLVKAINEFNGFNESVADLEEKAKN